MPKSQQQKGLDHESGVLAEVGARPTARSGAGWKKGDGHTEDEVVELKLAGKQHTVRGTVLAGLHSHAAKTGRTLRYRIYFEDVDLTLDGVVYPGR